MPNYSNSPLVTYTQISPNRTSPRNHAIDTLTVHCFVGQVTAKRGCEVFQNKSKQASCNYVVGHDGSIGLCVEEKDRSWCSSNKANDMRAITFEVASDTKSPYAVTDKALNALIDLIADICKRNGKTKIIWFADKNKTLAYSPKTNEMVMTVHRWFANKACPGDYLYGKHTYIVNEVNNRLSGAKENPTVTAQEPKLDTESKLLVKVLIDDLNIRNEPNMSGFAKGVTGKGVFTITEVKNGWGKLKSGAGWIYIDNPAYCKIL